MKRCSPDSDSGCARKQSSVVQPSSNSIHSCQFEAVRLKLRRSGRTRLTGAPGMPATCDYEHLVQRTKHARVGWE